MDVREQWSSKVEFLLSCIGFAVGYGNFWRFPFKCFKNGGGAFLLPFVITLAVAGIPLFFLELAVGQHTQAGPLKAWNQISPIFTGIGYGMVVVCFLVSIYYNVILAWSCLYFFNSFREDLPWIGCNHEWSSRNCCDLFDASRNTTCVGSSPSKDFFLNVVLNIGNGIHDTGSVNWKTTACLLFAWLMVYFCIWKGIKTTGKVVYVTATLPYIMLTVFLVRGLTLPGSVDGVLYFITPRWEKLLDAQVWVESASQVFYSLTLGFGVILTFASYNNRDNNFFRDAFIVSITDACTSILSGFVVFAYLGYMAHIQQKDISDPSIATDGPGLVFVVYPAALSTLKYSNVWSAIFFLMLITLGLDSQFGQVELICYSIIERFPQKLNGRREIVVLVICSFLCILGLPCMTQSGMYWFTLMDSFSASYSLLFLGACELVSVAWMYGAVDFKAVAEEMLRMRLSRVWVIMWKYCSPLVIVAILAFGLVRSKPLTYERTYVYPQWALTLGWLMCISSTMCVPLYAAKEIYFQKKTKRSAPHEMIVMDEL